MRYYYSHSMQELSDLLLFNQSNHWRQLVLYCLKIIVLGRQGHPRNQLHQLVSSKGQPPPPGTATHTAKPSFSGEAGRDQRGPLLPLAHTDLRAAVAQRKP